MTKAKYLGLAVIAIGLVYLTACDNGLKNADSLEDSLELFSGLEIIPEAQNSILRVNNGSDLYNDGYFKVKVSNILPNDLIRNGEVDAWCLEWKKPLRSNDDVHEGVSWYATGNNEKWKPINYLFSIRNELDFHYEDLTYLDIQAVVWTLAGHIGIAPEFDIDKLRISELPSRLRSGDEILFNRDYVRGITDKVLSEYSTSTFPMSGFALHTADDEQDIFVPGDPLDPCREEVLESNEVDVMLLFDDTGSFAGTAPAVQAFFPALMAELEANFPDISFGFGVSRFEDYGGPGTGFSGENTTGRPFILNQPIITSADAGGDAARDNLIETALGNTAAGFGGDLPETAIEALYQLATGAGFDGNGDGSTLGSGDAGSISAQTSPGTSGDVPAFSSNVLPTSGTLGGAGWRVNSQKIIIMATDVCTVSPFDSAEGIPDEITGLDGVTAAITKFACSSLTPGFGRFGFVSDSKTRVGNTIEGAIAPSESATVQETINALNALGIQVVGLNDATKPASLTGPSFNPWIFQTALARLTGAVDADGEPLVFRISGTGADIADSIADAIEATLCEVPSETAKLRMQGLTIQPSFATSDDDTTRYSNYVIFD
jgi:hypothetical protein